MLTKIRERLMIPKAVFSRRTLLSIYLFSLLFHLIFVQSLGHLHWKIKAEKWKSNKPAAQTVSLTVVEKEPPPPPQKKSQEKKAEKPSEKKSKPARRRRPRPVPKEVARIQSVDELMERYELARDIDEEEELDDFSPATPVDRVASAARTEEEKLEDPESLSNYQSKEKSYDGIAGGFEGFQGSFSTYLGLLRRAGLDVVFVIDATGSMGWIIEQVKTKITGMMDVIRKLVPTARLGLVAYRDRDEEYVTKLHPLTFRVGRLRQFLNGLEAKHGGDWEEAVDEGLKVAIEEIRWRRNAKKIIIVVGDAPPHKKDMDRTLQVIAKFRQQGGFVSTIDAGHESNDEEFTNYSSDNILKEFVEIASQGHGESTNLGRQKKIIQQLVILTFGSRWREVMAEYVEGL